MSFSPFALTLLEVASGGNAPFSPPHSRSSCVGFPRPFAKDVQSDVDLGATNIPNAPANPDTKKSGLRGSRPLHYLRAERRRASGQGRRVSGAVWKPSAQWLPARARPGGALRELPKLGCRVKLPTLTLVFFFSLPFPSCVAGLEPGASKYWQNPDLPPLKMSLLAFKPCLTRSDV